MTLRQAYHEKFYSSAETALYMYVHLPRLVTALQWRQNGSDSVSNHQPHDSLLNRYSDAAQKNIKAPHHWPLCGEFTGDQWILRANGQLRGKCFHLTTSSWPNVSCLRQDWESEVGHNDLILVKLGTPRTSDLHILCGVPHFLRNFLRISA